MNNFLSPRHTLFSGLASIKQGNMKSHQSSDKHSFIRAQIINEYEKNVQFYEFILHFLFIYLFCLFVFVNSVINQNYCFLHFVKFLTFFSQKIINEIKNVKHDLIIK